MTLHYKPRNLAIFKAGELTTPYIAPVIRFYYNKTAEKFASIAIIGLAMVLL